MTTGTSPNPMGGDTGALWLAPTVGGALVEVTGVQDATYDRGQNFAAAHGMDAGHEFSVKVKSKPSVKVKNIHDWAKAEVMKAIMLSEAGTGVAFAFYPKGNAGGADDFTHGIAGTAFVQASTSQSLSDAITNDLTLLPAKPDWAPFGDWAGV